LNGTHQLLAHAADVNLLGNNINILKKNIKVAIVANKDDGQEVNTQNTKYMLTSRHQNAGQNHNL
jgi:hypothetical protein